MTASTGEGGRRSWQPVDLGPVLDGTYRPPVPTVGARNDGVGLFYRGRVHTVVSESEGGKSWLALVTVARELAVGNSAVYIDFEDDEGGIGGRLLALGVPRHLIRDRFAYVRPDDDIRLNGNGEDLGAALGDLRPTFVTVDGVTEALQLHDMDLRDNMDVAKFGRLLLRTLAAHNSSPAVAALDHPVKDREGRGRFAIGAQHKLGAVSGAAYVVENRQPFGVGLTGRSTVHIAKDRPAQLRRHALPSSGGLHWFADLILDATPPDGSVLADIWPAKERAEDRPRPTHYMRMISAALARADRPLSWRDITSRVRGKDQHLREAIAALEDEGHVHVDRGGNAHRHTLIHPFTDDDDQTQP